MSDTKAPREWLGWEITDKVQCHVYEGTKSFSDKKFVEASALTQANSEIERLKGQCTQMRLACEAEGYPKLTQEALAEIDHLTKENERLQLQYRKRLEHSEEVRDERDRLTKENEALVKQLREYEHECQTIQEANTERDQLRAEVERLTALDYAKEDERRAQSAVKYRQCVISMAEALEGVRRFVYVSGDSSNNIVYEIACNEHVSEIDHVLSEYAKLKERDE